MKQSTLPFPFAKAMDLINQVLVLVISASFTNGKLENADLHYIASQLRVTHYDCREMTENNLYTLNQVSKCNIAHENLEVSGTFPTRNQCNSLQMHIPEWTMARRFWRRLKYACPSCSDNNWLNHQSISMQNHNEFQLLPTRQDVQQNGKPSFKGYSILGDIIHQPTHP